MPPLKNIKHEKFCRAVIEKPSYSQAYKSVFPAVKDSVVSSNCASRLVNEYPAVRNRINELLERDGITLKRLNTRLGELLEDKSSDVSLRSVRLGYELHGVLDKTSNVEANKDIAIQINILNVSGESEAITL